MPQTLAAEERAEKPWAMPLRCSGVLVEFNGGTAAREVAGQRAEAGVHAGLDSFARELVEAQSRRTTARRSPAESTPTA
jgi:hypothetical protein